MRTIAFTVILTFTFLLSAFICNAQGSGYALDFDGNSDYVTIANESNFDFERDDAFSIEVWFSTNWSGTLVSKESNQSSTLQRGWEVKLVSWGGIRFHHLQRWDFSQGLSVNTVGSFNDGEWHHVVAVYDGSMDASGMSIYVDGVKQTTNILKNNLTSSMTTLNDIPVNIGRRDASLYEYDGQIDEVRIWNRALAPAEIQTNMCQKLTGTEPGLVAYYRMDEGIDNTCSGGQDVCDLTGNGNHGTKY